MATQLDRIVLGLSLLMATALAASAADGSYQAKAAGRYPANQSQGDLVVAVKPFYSEKDQKSVFGKARPYEHGVMPLLLVITNTGLQPYELKNLKVRFITGDRDGLEPITGDELAFFNPRGHQPKTRKIPGLPGLNRTRVKKGPLARFEITDNEFKAPVLTPESTASGFFYYWTGTDDPLDGATAYISGIVNLATGQELFYFEIPLDRYR